MCFSFLLGRGIGVGLLAYEGSVHLTFQETAERFPVLHAYGQRVPSLSPCPSDSPRLVAVLAGVTGSRSGFNLHPLMTKDTKHFCLLLINYLPNFLVTGLFKSFAHF